MAEVGKYKVFVGSTLTESNPSDADIRLRPRIGVEFEGEELAKVTIFDRAPDGVSAGTTGVTETLYKVIDRDNPGEIVLIVHVEEWIAQAREPVFASLHQVNMNDLREHARFGLLGSEAGASRTLDYQEALSPFDRTTLE